MIVSLSAASACKQVQPLVNIQKGLTMESLFHHRKDKVVVILGATGTGKTKLAIDIANHFPPAEIINSDKMQVYKGLDITTNKVTEEETRGVPHHLLGTIDPNSNFTVNDFCHHASLAIDSIVGRDGLPIVAGGSNSYIDALVNHYPKFRLRYECCFLWVDVSTSVLHSFLSARVDRMIGAGQIDEVREIFDPSADYTLGIRKAIGVPEFDEFLKAEAMGADDRTKESLLEAAIARIKINNCNLANRQLQKIHRLYTMWRRNMHRLDATEAFINLKSSRGEEAWEEHVMARSRRIVHKFLYEEMSHVPVGIASPKAAIAAAAVAAAPSLPQVAMAAATH